MTFTTYLDKMKPKFYEQGDQAIWNRLHLFAAATTVGTFVAGAHMIGDIEMDAASNPGLTAAVGIDQKGSGQQDVTKGTAGQIDPSSSAVDRTMPTQFRS